MPVDEAAARAAIEAKIAAPLGLGVEEAALGIIRIAVANMSRAIRSVSTERGPRRGEFALLAFGGAGPLHAHRRWRSNAAFPGCWCPPSRARCAPAASCCPTSASISYAARSRCSGSTTWSRIGAAFAEMRREGDAWLDGERIPAERRRIRAGDRGALHRPEFRGPGADGRGIRHRRGWTRAFAAAFADRAPSRVRLRHPRPRRSRSSTAGSRRSAPSRACPRPRARAAATRRRRSAAGARSISTRRLADGADLRPRPASGGRADRRTRGDRGDERDHAVLPGRPAGDASIRTAT